MSAIGDSTSTATLAQYKRSQAMNPLLHVSTIYEFLKFALSGGNKFSLSDWRLSWTTGLGSKKVTSHAARLRQLNPNLSISNFAEPGANIQQVWSSEVPKLKQWSRQALGKNYPDYITLMVGANDICADSLEEATPVKSYILTYKKILNEILGSSPTTKILAIPLPPFQDLKSAGSAFLLAFPGMNSCNGFWKMAPLCKSITHGDDTNTQRVAERVNETNRELYKAIITLRSRYGDRVRLATQVAQRRIKKSDLSIDCFHPNANAQNELAQVSWASTWWAK